MVPRNSVIAACTRLERACRSRMDSRISLLSVPVWVAWSVTSTIELLTLRVPLAASATLRAISLVAAFCSYVAAAIAEVR